MQNDIVRKSVKEILQILRTINIPLKILSLMSNVFYVNIKFGFPFKTRLLDLLKF